MVLLCVFSHLVVASYSHINERSFRMKGVFKPQLSKVLCGGVNISWLKFAFRGLGYHWIKQDIWMPLFWHFITLDFVQFSPWEMTISDLCHNVWWRLMVLISISSKKKKKVGIFLAIVHNTYFIILTKKPPKFQLWQLPWGICCHERHNHTVSHSYHVTKIWIVLVVRHALLCVYVYRDWLQ